MDQTKKTYRRWREYLPKSIECVFNKTYKFSWLKADLFAGMTVGIIALPLSMALGISSGLTPSHGLYTAIVAGFFISLLGGSRVQVGGPTGAFVVIIYDILARHGYEGLILATLFAGFLLILMGIARLGVLIKYIPYPLVTGLTLGIACILFLSQMKDFFGLQTGNLPADFIAKLKGLMAAFPTCDPWAVGVGVGTLGLIIAIRRFLPRLPWAIASVGLVTTIVWILDLPIETVLSRYGELPRGLPKPGLPALPWNLTSLRILIPDAFTIAILAGLESLLAAVIGDRMAGSRHKPNCELIGQGIANIGACFFGGMPATGAFARTAANIKSGAKTPIAGMMHALVVLCILYAFGPVVSLVPLPALAAVLIVIAWQMSELSTLKHLLRAPLGDISVLVTTFFLTILLDIPTAVGVGIGLAACFFIKRMGDHKDVVRDSSQMEEEAESKKSAFPGIEVYEINGPLFFGVVDHLRVLGLKREKPPKVLILLMRKVPMIDASGLHALYALHEMVQKQGIHLMLSGIAESPLSDLKRFGLDARLGRENILPHIDAALARAESIMNG